MAFFSETSSSVRLATETGSLAIDSCQPGDRLVTASGGVRIVKWVGRRKIDGRRDREPEFVGPIRVSENAFGDGVPCRDLGLSPEHNIAIGDALIPISRLVNGVSIAQIETDAIEYWHVELDQHDVVLAEGLPAESYLDSGDRATFDNGAAFIEAFPDFRPLRWDETCLLIVKNGPLIAETKARLIARLLAQGYVIDHEADVFVRADEQRVEPMRLGERRFGFVLPPNSKSITLCSNTFTASHTQAASTDTRKLGLCVKRLQIDGEELALAGEAFGEGWYACEQNGDPPARRWTNGAARLPSRSQVVVIDIADVGYYLRAPRQAQILPFTHRSASGERRL